MSTGADERPRWLVPLMIVGTVVAVLMLGVSAGLLIGMQQSQSNAAPAADSVDVGFSQDMTVHHRQAVTMAAQARTKAADPLIRTLAYDIESTQLEQIGRMQGWLSLWGRDRLPTGKHMEWMTTAHAAEHQSLHTGITGIPQALDRMPGMATPADLDRLSKATGQEFDILFLQLMLRHHEGGRIMLAYAADHADVPVVRILASQMLVAQGKETEYLKQLLTERGAQPLPN